jgi:hypothetical protein
MSEEPKPLPVSAVGVTVIPNVQLEPIEKAIYARQYEPASQMLLVALRHLKIGAQFIGYAIDPRVQASLYTRLAAAMVALLTDPKFGISQEGFDHFASEHAIIDVLFRASVFETSDHMLAALSSNPSETDKAKLQIADGNGLVKFLLTYSMRSGFGLSFEETFTKSPQVMFSLWAGMISPLITTAVQAQDRRELLLGLHKIFENVSVPDPVLATVSDAYMYTSYGIRRDKHDAKATIHQLIGKMLRTRGVKLPDAPVMARRRKERLALGGETKPTILICVEWFSHLHAMFRCYAPIIRQLRSKFRLVGMSRACDIDELGKAEFDEWREVSMDGLVLEKLVQEIVSTVRPDIIYYPSLGMAMWWVIMASARLAPIQVMTLGHPASSRSPFMDYVICEEKAIGDSALFSERIVEMPTSSARFVMRPDGEFPVPEIEETPEVIRIAIPAMLCKLNATFMHSMRRIAESQHAVRVEFHFFVNMLGINLFQAARELRDWLGDRAFIYERANYPDYTRNLRRCHLHFSTFPFGGTNSTIDSMLHAIPVLTKEGDEPHERFDAMMIRHAGQPESLIAKSVDEYVEMANRLIDSNEMRVGLSRKLIATDLRGLFFGEPDEDRRHSFVDAMTKIYDEHEALQNGPRVISIPPRTT